MNARRKLAWKQNRSDYRLPSAIFASNAFLQLLMDILDHIQISIPPTHA
jgi:hypothetical protein